MTARTLVITGWMAGAFLSFPVEAARAEPEVRSLGILQGADPDDSMNAVSEFVEVLTRSIESRKVLRVVPPSEFPNPSGAEFTPQRFRAWAKNAGVDAVVSTRAVPTPGGSNFDVQVRMGHSGALISEFTVNSAGAGGAKSRVDSLAGAILESLGYGARVSAGTAEVSPAEAGAGSSTAELVILPKGAPVAIQSDELEVTQQDDEGRRLVFLGNVQVVRGDIRLDADRLEAFYPQGASRPEQLEAEGHVEVVQGDRRGRCETAIYDSVRQQVLCRGRAELTQGCETVRGSEIQFDLAEERVRVIGAASVVIQPGGEETDCEGEAS